MSEADPATGVAARRVPVAGDNPIKRLDEDRLGRAPLAKSFADQVLSLDASQGLVVGVLGAWGFGKTSFVNLTRDNLTDAGIQILDFNPWMFSGAEALVDSFFIELAAQLKIRPQLVEIGKQFEGYGEAFSGMAWLPLIGVWIERGRLLTRALAKCFSAERRGSVADAPSLRPRLPA